MLSTIMHTRIEQVEVSDEVPHGSHRRFLVIFVLHDLQRKKDEQYTNHDECFAYHVHTVLEVLCYTHGLFTSKTDVLGTIFDLLLGVGLQWSNIHAKLVVEQRCQLIRLGIISDSAADAMLP
jgi:hypothetical protein